MSLAVSVNVMGAEFTPVTHGMKWGATNFLNEFQTTFRDHVRIRTEDYVPVYDPIEAGTDIQSTNLWRLWQDWASNNCSFFVNDQAQLTNVLSVPMLTYTGLLQQVGLTNGLRRVDKDTNWNPSVNDWTLYGDPMYSYGHMEEGDIIGPWIFDDLQSVYDGMKWTVDVRGQATTPTLFVIDGELKTRSDSNADEATAKAAHELNWTNATSWVGSTNEMVYYGVGAVIVSDGSFEYFGSRRRAKGVVQGIMTNLQHTTAVYLHPYRPAGTTTFADTDNQGWTGSTLTQFFEDLAIGRNTSETSSLINFATSELAPSATIPITPPTASTFTTGARVDKITFVHKWEWNYTKTP